MESFLQSLPVSVPIAWLILAIILGVLETLTLSLGFALVGLSAVLAAIVAFARGNFELQLGVFAVCILISLTLLRPKLRKLMHQTQGVPTRTGALLGVVGRVTESIDSKSGRGRVEIQGQDWAARSASLIAAGSEIKVVAADGIVLIVEPV